VSPPAVPNWLQSPLKPRARLYMEVASSHNDHQPRVDLWWDKRLSKVQGGRCSEVISSSSVRLANSKAGIKPTAPLSAFDKENSIEFLLDSVHYLYKQSNPNPVLLSCASLWVNLPSYVCYYKFKKKRKEKEKQYSKLKEKKKKRKRNNDLAVLPSHNKMSQTSFRPISINSLTIHTVSMAPKSP